MNNHNIENFMKLAANHKGTREQESRNDGYYRKVYQRTESGEIMIWNWAAGLGGWGWLIYRKMYLSAVAFIMIGLLYVFSLIFMASTVSETVIIYLISLTLLPLILLGFFGNWLYVRRIHKKIDKNYHLCSLKNTDEISLFLSLLLSIFVFFPVLIVVIRDRIKLRRELSNKNADE